jgi:SWI/SNF-related matrix-associated actin-dependent regulator of chromatin subfamily A member 5
LTTVAREFEDKGANGTTNGKSKRDPEDEENDEDSVLSVPAKKRAKNGVKVCHDHVFAVSFANFACKEQSS